MNIKAKSYISVILLLTTFVLNSNAGLSYNLNADLNEIVLETGSNDDIVLLLNGETVMIPQEDLRVLPNDLKEGINLIQDKNNIRNSKLYFKSDSDKIKKIPFWLSIIPPLLAIILALIFKEVLPALFAGIWAGAFISQGLHLKSFFSSITKIADTYLIEACTDSGHMSVIIFSLLIGGTVAIITRNGGMQGVVDGITKYSNTKRKTQLTTWFLGIAVFFDDYANTLVVGSTMRPLSDRFKISREKLAYIVDSTAAPVAAIAFVTTWIGAELGYIQDAIQQFELETSAYSIFLNSLKYALYPILTILFVFLVIVMKRDFKIMQKTEAESQGLEGEVRDANFKEEVVSPKDGIKHYWWNAFIPIFILIVTILAGLLITGGYFESSSSESFFKRLQTTIGNSDSYVALLWASLLSLLSAVVLSIGSRSLSLRECFGSMMKGFQTMLTAVLILVLAWTLAGTIEELHTASFLLTIIPSGLDPHWLPLVVFLLSAVVSFSTGSSWGTMAILFPLVLPLAWILGNEAGLEMSEIMNILYNSTAVVLAGSVFGDHCSPISDTTILSSLATGCDHISHVRTQLPYAISVGIISLICGGVLFALGIHWFINLIIGIGLCFALILRLNKNTDG